MPLMNDTRITARTTGRLVAMRVADGAVIHLGAMVASNVDGYAVPAAAAPDMAVIGVAQAAVDNAAGGDGQQLVPVQKGTFGIRNSAANPVEQGDVGRPVFVEDDGAVTSEPGADNVVAGVVDELGDDGLVYVHFA